MLQSWKSLIRGKKILTCDDCKGPTIYRKRLTRYKPLIPLCSYCNYTRYQWGKNFQLEREGD